MEMLNRERVDLIIEDELAGLYYLKKYALNNIKMYPLVVE